MYLIAVSIYLIEYTALLLVSMLGKDFIDPNKLEIYYKIPNSAEVVRLEKNKYLPTGFNSSEYMLIYYNSENKNEFIYLDMMDREISEMFVQSDDPRMPEFLKTINLSWQCAYRFDAYAKNHGWLSTADYRNMDEDRRQRFLGEIKQEFRDVFVGE